MVLSRRNIPFLQDPRRPASARGEAERPGPPGPPGRGGGIAGASPLVLGGASGMLGDLRRIAAERLAAEQKAKRDAERQRSPPEDGEVQSFRPELG